MEKVYNAVRDLTAYGLAANLIEKEDVIYTVNSLLGALGIEDYPGNKAEIIRCAEEADPAQIADGTLLEGILEVILDYAAGKDMVDGSSVVMRDLFDTKIMGILTPRPSQVIAKFRKLYEDSPLAATDWYYRFSQNTDYIRRYRIARDRRWKSETPYGDLDITINLSKPEKDPKAIAAARNAAQSSYPKCQLCVENEGYFGRVNHPARENHRIIPITIQNGPWGFQYSPYVYYNEHCIVFNSLHIPMAINHNTFCKLFDFVKAFPHYFLGSNADLPIVGGSILSHDHFQGGHYDFAMAKAPVERTFTVDGFEDVGSGRRIPRRRPVHRRRGQRGMELLPQAQLQFRHPLRRVLGKGSHRRAQARDPRGVLCPGTVSALLSAPEHLGRQLQGGLARIHGRGRIYIREHGGYAAQHDHTDRPQAR